MPKPTAEDVESRLRDALQAAEVVVVDTSSGCGSSFDVAVVSAMFEGKGLLQRHRLINDALKEEMKEIHALSIKHVRTPEQQAEQAAKIVN